MGKKNIIFYFSDQQRWDTVNEEVTPNLCALAKEGIKYENNFTCQPVCGPARACLQTGVYATQCGCYWNGIPLPSDIKPLAHYFNEAGYQTAYIGKWHLASNRLPGVGLHCESTAIPREKQGEYQYFRGADVLEFTSHGYDGYIFDESGNKLDFKGYRADCINDYALEFLDKRDKDKPFFMFVSQLEPHHQNDHHTYESYKPTVEKYKDYPLCEKRNVLLPVPCNQKMNSYLKEIADLCAIKKNLSTHSARHSYATSVCLANGVSIENVAKMLGHSNISMTKRYARVLDQSILNDMQKVGSNLTVSNI